MKRRIVPLFFVALVLALASGAGAGGPVVALSGTSDYGVQTSSIHGTVSGKLGKGTYAGTLSFGDSFANPGSACQGSVCAPVTGTITFSTNRGDLTVAVQPDGIVGFEDTASFSWQNFELPLEIVDGTGALAHVAGTLTLTYTSTHAHYVDDNGILVDTIEDTGSLTGKLRQAQSS